MAVDFTAIDKQKAEIDQYRPFSRHTNDQLRKYFRVGLTYSSNAIEGNTLSEAETKVAIEDGLTAGGKPLRDYLEAQGHADAFDHMLNLAKGKQLNEADLKELHRLFFFRIDQTQAGIYRTVPVVITGTDYLPPKPEKIPSAMKDLFTELEAKRTAQHAVEYAASCHIGVANIHPFIDGNGRAARLFMNLALLQSGYCITIVPPVARVAYIDACKLANQGNTQAFLKFLVVQVYESQKDYLRLLRSLCGPDST